MYRNFQNRPIERGCSLHCAGAVASRRHDNHHHQHHHHHHRQLTSTSNNRLVYCEDDVDCRQPNDALKGGETCHWLYEGCSVGICMCDPLTQKKHAHTGKCITGEDGINLISEHMIKCCQLTGLDCKDNSMKSINSAREKNAETLPQNLLLISQS